MNLNILYEDARLLVLDKPAGLLAWKEGAHSNAASLGEILVRERPEQKSLGVEKRYGIAHRLDKDTSGVLLVAKTEETFGTLQELFRERRAEKTYTALVHGTFKEEAGTISLPLGRSQSDRRKQQAYEPGNPKGIREAITAFRVLEDLPGYTLLMLSPKTGRKHQIRAHLVSLGHPLAGDRMYAFKNQKEPKGLSRHFLHASSVRLALDGTEYSFESPLPPDLVSVLNSLRTHHGNTN